MEFDHEVQDPVLPLFAMAIGQLCQGWADLEHSTLLLLGVLSGMPRTSTSLNILRCFEFRDQLAAIKVAAVANQTDHVIVDHIIDAVDHVDNALRPRRNRLVHDRWEESGQWLSADRITSAPKLRRGQAFQPREITSGERTQETYNSMFKTVAEDAAYAEYFYTATMAVAEPGDRTRAALIETRPPNPFPPPDSKRPYQTATNAQGHK